MKKPNLFIVGAKKSGTTAMYEYLKGHPEIFMSKIKEPSFFAGEWTDNEVFRNEADYLSLFSAAQNEKRVGEASTSYLCSEQAADRIRKFNPSAKIIIMLRNPVDMLLSLHAYLLWMGWEDIPDFEAALDAEADRKQGHRIPYPNYPSKALHYREVVGYAVQIKRYRDAFSLRNIQIIVFDDFVRQTKQVYQETCRFLDVDPERLPTFEVINENRTVRNDFLHRLVTRPFPVLKKSLRTVLPRSLLQRLQRSFLRWNSSGQPRPAISPQLRMRLQSELAPEVEELSELIGRDLVSIWNR